MHGPFVIHKRVTQPSFLPRPKPCSQWSGYVGIFWTQDKSSSNPGINLCRSTGAGQSLFPRTSPPHKPGLSTEHFAAEQDLGNNNGDPSLAELGGGAVITTGEWGSCVTVTHLLTELQAVRVTAPTTTTLDRSTHINRLLRPDSSGHSFKNTKNGPRLLAPLSACLPSVHKAPGLTSRTI